MKRNTHSKHDNLNEDLYDEYHDVNYQKIKRQKNLKRKSKDKYDDYYDDWN